MTTQILEGEYRPSSSQWVRDQVDLYERTGGREGNTLMDTGLPVIILTTRGRQSGTVRKVALMRVEHDGEYAVIGSQGGAPQHPAWVHNLRTAPEEVALQDGPEPFAARAREVEGDERARWWERAVAAYPPYADYQTKTARHIPVFVITRTT
ncbi:MAG TPA: nitroreductase family deazaflavin-dependent oxidoreductase [Candidatus Nocardiopsis merdipullorum]|nr:nitroreductase family deazaflavin-dependent oxidoreductase [Candidatus Nocardiopsis merdipullorum]